MLNKKNFETKLVVLFIIIFGMSTWVLSSFGFSINTLLCMIFSALVIIGLEITSVLYRIESKTNGLR